MKNQVTPATYAASDTYIGINISLASARTVQNASITPYAVAPADGRFGNRDREGPARRPVGIGGALEGAVESGDPRDVPQGGHAPAGVVVCRLDIGPVEAPSIADRCGQIVERIGEAV